MAVTGEHRDTGLGHAIGRGVLAALPPLGVLAALQVGLLVAYDDPPNAWALPLFALLVWAFVRAGAAATTWRPSRPLTTGAGAGLAVLVVWVAVRLAVSVADAHDQPLAGLGAAVGLSVLAGMVGAVLALRRGGRPS